MNRISKKQIFLIVGICLLAVLMIGCIWGCTFIDFSEDDTTDTSSAATTTKDSDFSDLDKEETTSASTAEATTEASTTASETSTYPEVTLPAADKRIALTFDDGPSSVYTREILDVLNKYNAKATFFVVGYQLSQSKGEILRQMISAGHEIGNHSATHPSSLTTLSEEALLEEITDVNERIYELTGGYVCTLLRPPGGHIDKATADKLYAGGIRMHTILWDADTRDWESNAEYKNGTISREEAIANAKALALSQVKDGSILLMHDIKEITPDLLEELLETLANDGYEFVTVSELFDFESMGEEAYTSKFYAEHDVKPLQ